MKTLVVAAAVVAGSATAHAQPGTVEPQPIITPLSLGQPLVQPIVVDTVDEATAVGLSLGGTVASWVMLIAGTKYDNSGLAAAGALGTMFAPSFGHWYAHHAFSRGLGLRGLGAGAAIIGISMALDHLFDESYDNSDDGTITGLLLVGAGLYIAGTVDDIATAGSAARKYNHRFEDVGIVPQINPHGGGVALTGRF